MKLLFVLSFETSIRLRSHTTAQLRPTDDCKLQSVGAFDMNAFDLNSELRHLSTPFASSMLLYSPATARIDQ